MIEGVEIKELRTHPDERGFFREVVRVTDGFFAEGFAQLSHSYMYPGVAKAWHVHKTQVDWWYVPVGALKLALYDTREDSPTHGRRQELYLGEQYPTQVVKIPPGVAHGSARWRRRTSSTSPRGPTIPPKRGVSRTTTPPSATTGRPVRRLPDAYVIL